MALSPVFIATLTLLATPPTETITVEARLTLSPELARTTAGVEVELEAIPAGALPGKQEAPPSLIHEVAAPGSYELTLPAGARAWDLSVRSEETWASVVTLVPEPRKSTEIRLWPATVLEGRASFVDAKSPPEALRLRLESAKTEPGSRAPIERSFESCPLSEGHFRCRIPAGRLDLRLDAEHFVPKYFWNVFASTDEPHSLGVLQFERGASVAGYVETTDASPIGDSCRVVLKPGNLGDPRPLEDHHAESLELSTSVDKRGFFQLRGVPPNVYSIAAHQEGFAPAQRYPILVGDVTLVELGRPLVLERPSALSIFVTPPLTPAGQPWLLQLEKLGRLPGTEIRFQQRQVPENGALEWLGLEPGEYRLLLRDADRTTWQSVTTRLSESTPTLFLDVPVGELRGRLLLGDEPLAARLKLTDEVGRSLSLESDAEGRFDGPFLGAGTWSLSVTSKEPQVRREGLKVDLEEPPEGRPAEIEIRLPATLLKGSVVDEAGLPALGAAVVVVGEAFTELPVTVRVDEEGAFRLRGLPEGSFQLMAEDHRRRRSPTVEVEIDEARGPTEARLEVADGLRVSGEVRSAEGPVRGALVVLEPSHAPATPAEPGMARVDGRFEVVLPRGTRTTRFTVLAPGFALQAGEAAVDEEQPLVLTVARNGGDLRVDFPAEVTPGGGLSEPGIWLLHEGGYLSGSSLHQWLAIHGAEPPREGSVTIPALAPGSYTACLLEGAAVYQGLLTGAWPSGRCRGVTVPPFGQARVRLALGES